MKRTKAPIYGIPVLLFRTCEELTRYADPYSDELSDTARCSDGLTIGLGNGAIGMAIDPDKESPVLVAHEALHTAWYILSTVGVEVDEGNHEALAYLQGWVIEKWYQMMVTRGSNR